VPVHVPVLFCAHYFQAPARQARTGKWPAVFRFSKDKVTTEMMTACADLKTKLNMTEQPIKLRNSALVLSVPFRVLI